mgnify:CR=1 FL=1
MFTFDPARLDDFSRRELMTAIARSCLGVTLLPIGLQQAIAADDPDRVRLLELADAFTPEDVQMYYQIAIHGRAEIDLAPDAMHAAIRERGEWILS